MATPRKAAAKVEKAVETEQEKHSPIMVKRPVGFIDEEGVLRLWGAGQIVEDREHIERVKLITNDWE